MVHEIETKVLDIDGNNIIKKITALGASKTQETRLIVDWYRLKGIQEGQDPWFLRIRSNSEGKHEVTWKAKSEILGIARKHKEINFLIPEPEKLSDLFEEIGLEKYAHQEKDRVSFSFKNYSFDVDTYPLMSPYLEIESDSEESVKEAITLLGLENNKTWAKGERILIQEVYKLDWYNMKF
jgi:adenylate cyclase class 2